MFTLGANSYRVSSTPKLHNEFRKAVKELPKDYSPEYKQRFYHLIDNFGTHYIRKVKKNPEKDYKKTTHLLIWYSLKIVFPGETRRKCLLCDQHQAV